MSATVFMAYFIYTLSTIEVEKELTKHSPALIHALTTNEANLLIVNLEGIIYITRLIT